MKYAILIDDENTVNPEVDPDPALWGQVMAEYNAFTKVINEAGVNLGGEALQQASTATTVQVEDGQTPTTDGPFAETKEGLGGSYILECKDLDEALAWAARCPGSWYGKVEVRPVMIFEEYDEAAIEHRAVGSAWLLGAGRSRGHTRGAAHGRDRRRARRLRLPACLSRRHAAPPGVVRGVPRGLRACARAGRQPQRAALPAGTPRRPGLDRVDRTPGPSRESRARGRLAADADPSRKTGEG